MATPALVDPKADYLDEDTIVPNGQRFALVSFVGPEQRQKNDKFGMKVRGCFGTRDEAAAHVRKLQAFDGAVDIFLLEVGKWALCPPTADDVDDVEYQERYMNDLMKGYKESQAKAKEVFDQRTEAIKKDGLDKNLLPSEILPRPTSGLLPAGTIEPGAMLEELESSDPNVASGSGSA